MRIKRNLTSFCPLRVFAAQELLATLLARALFLGCTVYQTLETVFHRLSKHLECRQEYSFARPIFNSLLGVCFLDESLFVVFGISSAFWLLIKEQLFISRLKPLKFPS